MASSPPKTALFHYDIVSPYNYLFMEMRHPVILRLESAGYRCLPQPIFFGGLLRLQNNRGPAEVAAKRDYTYRYCTWRARQLAVPFCFPPRHPFSSLAAQRLLLQQQADWNTIEKAFRFVWQQGRDPETKWNAFCQALGLPANTPTPSSAEVKQALVNATADAAAKGVFGVPSIYLEDEGALFWGCDGIPFLLDYLDTPNLFKQPEYQALQQVQNPLLAP